MTHPSDYTLEQKLKLIYGANKKATRTPILKMIKTLDLHLIDECTGECLTPTDCEKIFNELQTEKMSTENKKVEGVIIFRPHEKAPKWIKGQMVISVKTFFDWIKENKEAMLHKNEKYGDQLKLSLKMWQDGSLYVEVDTYGIKKKEEEKKQGEGTQGEMNW